MHSPLVSVVIATYNSGIYLQEAIDSILRQSVGDLELLVIDDGSTDDTRQLVAGIRDERLSYIWQANAGQTSAKNHGLQRARGEYIGFCDGDDYWYPNKLELQLPLFERSAQTGVVYSAAATIDEHGNPLGKELAAQYRGDVTAQLFMANFVPFGTAIVRRRCIEELGPFDSSLAMGIDWDLWLRVSAKYHFDFVAQPTYAYRIWSGQMSKNWRGRYSSAFRIMDKFVRANPGKISPRLRQRAIADTLCNRARARMGETPLQAIMDGAKATLLDPFAAYSWKTLLRTAANATNGRSSPTSPAPQRRDETHGSLKHVLAPVARTLTGTRPRIFMYHRFAPAIATRALGADEFRRQMLLLKERCDVLTLSELIDRESNGTRSAKPAAVVTVDDGYADVFRVAAPILQELSIPATVFVTTGFIDRKLFLWPDQLRALIERSAAGTFRVGGYWQGLEIRLGSKEERELLWNDLADRLLFTTTATRESAIADLADSLQLSIDDNDMSAYEAMTWAELRQLHDAGFEIGDHSCTHACLPALSDEDLEAEIVGSKALLERSLGSRVRSFAYPNGTLKDSDERVIKVLRQAGYEHAVLAVPAPVSLDRRFELGRFSGTCSLERFKNLVDGFGILRS
jgi:glycosyltransferase involved in cell wall biosynthesis/peptidoglycan/xylan/chitin deacetylase (PgdA/CDA1 family)